MTSLRMIEYEPANGPSLYDLWERGSAAPLQAPLSVANDEYRRFICELFASRKGQRHSLISIGAGNGFVERELADAGWNVLATDIAPSALRLCASKGLDTKMFRLLVDRPFGNFDAIYIDGVLGHLWTATDQLAPALTALHSLGKPTAIAVLSNDLADDDKHPNFEVSSSPNLDFYRPTPGSIGRQAKQTGCWNVLSEALFCYNRYNTMRRRELLILSLVNNRVETKYSQ